MANRHAYAETRSTSLGFIMGLLVGTLVGAGLGILLAPKAGADVRGEIQRRGRNMGQQAADRYREASDTASRWADRGRETVDRVRSAVSKGAEEARRFTARTAGEQGTDPGAKNPASES